MVFTADSPFFKRKFTKISVKIFTINFHRYFYDNLKYLLIENVIVFFHKVIYGNFLYIFVIKFMINFQVYLNYKFK